MSRTPVQGGTPASYRLARRLVIGMVVLVLLFCTIEGWASGLTTGLACLGFFALVGLIGAALSHQTRARRQRSFVRDLGGSLDRAREVLNVELVRSLRAERGDIVAAREIQRELPELSVAQIGELLRSL